MRSPGFTMGLIAMALLAPPVLSQERGPDAHVVRPVRGDIIDVRGFDAYVPPVAGWRYVPLRRGDTLRPGFFAARYEVAGYVRKQLPATKANVRWVRYGDDLVAVDMRTGRVSRVVANGYRRYGPR